MAVIDLAQCDPIMTYSRQTPPSDLRRFMRKAKAIACLGTALVFASGWLALPRHSHLARQLEKLVWLCVLGGFGVEVRSTGVPLAGAVTTANHISWTDIPVLAALCPAAFVAKKDVEQWPVLGALARHYGCIFADRGKRSSACAQVQQLTVTACGGQGAVVFAEGTTSDGFTVRPFKSSLFEAACNSGALITPTAITYRNRDGSPQSPAQRRLVAWLDDDSLLPHALALAASGGVIAEVHFGEPIRATDRKEAARLCRDAILQRLELFEFPDQAAMRKRVA